MLAFWNALSPFHLLVLGLALLACLAIYFAPAVVAIARRHERRLSVFALNLLAGWTVVGWIVALLWSLQATAASIEGAAKRRLAVEREIERLRQAGGAPTQQQS